MEAPSHTYSPRTFVVLVITFRYIDGSHRNVVPSLLLHLLSTAMEEFNPYDIIPQAPYVDPQSSRNEPTSTADDKEQEKEKEVSTGLRIPQNMEEAASRRRRVAYSKVLLPTLGITTAILGLVVGLNVYVLQGRSIAKIGSTTIGTTAQPQYIVTISQVLSSVVDKSAALLALIVGYYVAADWLSITDRRLMPTPQQYGVALNNLRSGHLGTLVSTALTLEDRTPRYSDVPMAGVYIGWLIGNSFLIAFLDFLLHLFIQSTLYQHTALYPDGFPRDLGRVIDDGLCQAYRNANPSSISALTCGLIGDNSVASPAAVSSGLQALAASSMTSKLVWGDSWNVYDHVILVPGSIPSNITYTARTYGVSTNCQSITSQCVDIQNPSSSGSAPTFHCGGSPSVALDNVSIQAGNLPFGVLYPSGTVGSSGYQAIDANPFPVIAVVNSLANYNTSDTFDSDLGFFTYGSRAWNVFYCNVSTDLIQYTYRPTTTTKNGADYTLRNLGPAPLNVSILTGAMVSSGLVGSLISQATDGVQFWDGMYDFIYPIQLSRHLLAFSSMAYANTDAEEISGWVSVQGSSVSSCWLGIRSQSWRILLRLRSPLIMPSKVASKCLGLTWVNNGYVAPSYHQRLLRAGELREDLEE